MSDDKKDGLIKRTIKLPFRYFMHSTKYDRSYFRQRTDSLRTLTRITRSEISSAGKYKEPLAKDRENYRIRYRNARLAASIGLLGVVGTSFIMLTASSVEMLLISAISFGGLVTMYLRLVMVLLKARISFSNFKDIKYRNQLTISVPDFFQRAAEKPSVLLPLSIDSKEARI